MDAGTAFRHRNKAFEEHLWFVISDHAQNEDEIAQVNLTKWAPWKDHTCELGADDHEWIMLRSCIDYRHAELRSIDEYEIWQTRNMLDIREPLTPIALSRIQAGAMQSPHTPFNVKAILNAQGLGSS